MNILLINIRYGYVGGPERYMLNLKTLLESNQHRVIPFSVRYKINEPSEFDKYFVSPLDDENTYYFKNQKWNIKSIIKTLERNFYSKEVERNLSRLIKDAKPDFAFVLLYLRKLSPAVLTTLKHNKIPFLVRLSDYGMICPSHNLFRENSICELCTTGNLFHSVQYKCVHDSYGASLVNYLATKYHMNKGYFNLIDKFVSPSKFLIQKMVDAGWSKEKFSHLPTFAYVPETRLYKKNPYQIIYSGRLEYIKGVHHLLQSVKILSEKHSMIVRLKLAGNGNEKYILELKNYCSKNNLSGVEFMGNLYKEELFRHIQESVFSVIPSLCYDNLPNSALESLSLGTPLIATDHGCFPELVKENETGFLFKHGNVDDLAVKMKLLFDNSELCREMSHKAVAFIKENYSPQKHYDSLISVIEKIKSVD